MRYETLDGTVILTSALLSGVLIFNRNDYEHLNQKRESVHLSDRELAEIYPGARSYLINKVKDLKRALQELSNPNQIYKIKEETSNQNYTYQKAEEVNTARVTHLKNQIELLNKKIRHYENILYFMRHKNVRGDDLKDSIARAKLFPITSLIKFNRQGFAVCPFHDEKLPSMKYYPKTNTCWCFGCQSGGDAIAVAMKLKNLKFLDAVKYLTNG